MMVGPTSAADETSNETVSTSNIDDVDTISHELDNVDDCVSAADTRGNLVANDTKSKDSNLILESSHDDLIISDSEDEINYGSFTDFNKIMELNTDGTLYLSRDYKYNSSVDSSFTNGLVISKSIVIDGQGHTIDANGNKAFTINANHVTLKNMTILNSASYGVTWSGDEGTLEYITLRDYNAVSAIYWNGNNGKLKKLTAKKMNTGNLGTGGTHAGVINVYQGVNVNITDSYFEEITGPAIMSTHSESGTADNILIQNCIFNKSYTIGDWHSFIYCGYALYTIKDCKFYNCFGRDGLIANYFGPMIIDSCEFYNTTIQGVSFRSQSGGVILDRAGGSTITNCIFENSRVDHNGVLNLAGGTIVKDCTFINNAKLGTNAYIGSESATWCNGVYFASSASQLINCIFKNYNQRNVPLFATRDASLISSLVFDGVEIYNNTLGSLFGYDNNVSNGNFNNLVFDNSKIYNNNFTTGYIFNMESVKSGNFSINYPGNNTLVHDNNGAKLFRDSLNVTNFKIIHSIWANPSNFTDALDSIFIDGTIYLLPGNYNITEVTVNKPLTFKGMKGVVFNQTRFLSSFVPRTIFDSITFENGRIEFTDSPNSKVLNCTFNNQKRGIIRFYQSTLMTLNDITVNNSSGNIIDNIHISGSVFNNWVIFNLLNNINLGGFNNKFNGFKLLNSTVSYMYLHGKGSVYNNISIINSKVSSDNGLYLGGAGGYVNDLYIRNTTATMSNKYLTYNIQNLNGATFEDIKNVNYLFYSPGGSSFSNVILDNVNLLTRINYNDGVSLDLYNLTIKNSGMPYAFNLPKDSTLDKFNVYNSKFISGTILTLNSNSVLKESTFQDYTGHIVVAGTGVRIKDSSFIGGDNAGLNGSALDVLTAGNNLKLINVNFTSNTADYGGAIYVHSGANRLTFDYVNFTDNIATGADYPNDGNVRYNGPGGAIRFEYAVDSEGKVLGYSCTIDDFTSSTINMNSRYYNNIAGNVSSLLTIVYVVNDTSSWGGSGSARTREDAGLFETAFMIAGDSCTFVFVRSGDVFNYTGTNQAGILMPDDIGMTELMDNLVFQGNNTIIESLRFHITSNVNSFTATNITFTGNENTSVIIDGSNVVFEDCKFVNNGGNVPCFGAAAIVNGENAVFRNVTFTNNIANNVTNNGGFGGALYINASYVNITGCTFNSNGALRSGQHIYIAEKKNKVGLSEYMDISIIDSVFDNSLVGASEAGSSVSIRGYNVKVSGCNFTSNNANYGSGVSIIGDVASIIFTGNNFTKNNAVYDGSLYLDFTNSLGQINNVSDNYFSENNAFNGGAVFISNNCAVNKLIFDKNIFMSNNATNGGALYVYADNTILSGLTFVGNTAINYGGALYVSGEDVRIASNEFKSNSANQGGAIYACARLAVSDSNFTSNSAVNGGAIYSTAALTVLGSKFTGNSASGTGGALYLTAAGSSISESTFSGNTANSYRNVYSVSAPTFTGNTIDASYTLNSISDATYPADVAITGTFDDGNNFASNVRITANGNDATTFSLTNSNAFSASWEDVIPGNYNVAVANTDANNNKFVYTTTPTRSFTVSRRDVIYVGNTAGTSGYGLTADDPTTWNHVAELLAEGGTVYFTGGTYSNFYNKTVSGSWTLSAVDGATVVLDANNKGRIFTVSANNVAINGLTFKNGKVSNNQGSAIYWTGTDGSITNSVFTENTGTPISSTKTITISNTQMKNQITLTKSNINWGSTEIITGTFAHSAPSTVTIKFNDVAQGTYNVASSKVTASYAFTNPSTRSVGSYVVTDLKNILKEVL